jgi:hypothetical protein
MLTDKVAHASPTPHVLPRRVLASMSDLSNEKRTYDASYNPSGFQSRSDGRYEMTDAPKALPVPNGDFDQLVERLNAEELALCAIAVYAAVQNQNRQGANF